jgi:hypothetical protein
MEISSQRTDAGYRAWTPYEDEILAKMAKEKATDAAIAAVVGHTMYACRMRRHVLGLFKFKGNVKWTAEQDALLKQRRSEKVPFAAISAELGISRNACIGRANRLGLEKTRVPRTFDRKPKRERQAKPAARYAPPLELIVNPNFLGVSFFDLDKGMCRFPKGEGANMLFCGQPVEPDTSWCPYCAGVVFGRAVTTQPHCEAA